MPDDITIVITSSPCKRHPSTDMIVRTIQLLRIQLDSRILILLDGVKPEQEHLREAYGQYKAALYSWSLTQDRIDIIIFDDFEHQTGMIKAVIDQIDTPQMLFIEHDFPVVGDIPWDAISKVLSSGEADLVRFYWEPFLIPEHNHLFLDKSPVMIGDVPVVRTGQWSQRPHLATVALYRKIIENYLQDDRKTYIEDAIHGNFGGPFVNAPAAAWKENKLCIYHPLRGSISRCEHLDGRMGEDKYGL